MKALGIRVSAMVYALLHRAQGQQARYNIFIFRFWCPLLGVAFLAAYARLAAAATPSVPGQGVDGPVEKTPSASDTYELSPAATDHEPGVAEEDDYAHVFYQFSPTSGVHMFIRAADGHEREITDEPGWEARHKAALEAHHGTRREGYVQSHPELDQPVREAILTGGLVRGMTTEQVRASAGDPVNENRTLTREGVVEEWHYGITLPDATGELPLLDGHPPCAEGRVVRKGNVCVVHFLDGVLFTWETSSSAGDRTPLRRGLVDDKGISPSE